MSTTTSITFSPTARGDRLRNVLSQAASIALDDGYQGKWPVAGGTAHVRLEPSECIEVWLSTSRPPSPHDALAINRHLPGNVRYALDSRGLGLLADTYVDGEAHLPRSLRSIEAGFCLALGVPPAALPKDEDIVPDSENVKAALSEAASAGAEPVERDGGWELRRRVADHSLVIRVAVDGAEVRVFREVLPALPEDVDGPAVYEALRYNGRLRHVRISADRNALVAETRLHGGLLATRPLAMALDAVAAASRHVQLPLKVLAEQQEVARCYRRLFPVQPR